MNDQAPPAHPTLDRVHLVGVGGAGMSGIARILLARGAEVSGSDVQESVALAALRALGATVSVGHDASHLSGEPVVVASSAIRATNPELVAARERGLVVLPRAGALAALMSDRVGVAVSGTHGKTTTTSMLVVALQHCGADPSFAIGGDLNEVGSGAHEGSGTLFIAEADESDGSFLRLSPFAAIVTNVDADHLDHYGSRESVAAAFEAFTKRLPQEGILVICADDPGARALASSARARGVDVRSFGQSDRADLRMLELAVEANGTSYEVVWHGERLGQVALSVVGAHNALDSAAALLTGLSLGFAFTALADGLAGFGGARRRFEQKGTTSGVRVYDDYAHNPAKVAAALTAARVVAGEGRLIVAFQPHLYSRTAQCAAEFGVALALADEVVVLEVYGAREDPVPGVSGAMIADEIRLPPGRVRFEPSMSKAADVLADLVRPGDLLMTIGAGDVTVLGPNVLGLLSERASL